MQELEKKFIENINDVLKCNSGFLQAVVKLMFRQQLKMTKISFCFP